MADNDSTSQRNFNNSSTLHSIISNADLLHQIGYDQHKKTATYAGSIEDLSKINDAADCSITTIGLGIAAIGKLMTGRDKAMDCFSEEDLAAIGWLLNDLGSSVVALQNIQTTAGDAIAASKI